MALKSRLANSNVYGIEQTIKNIWIEKYKRVCTAVHPDHPHLLECGGNSRGRKIHLDKGNEIHTVCNMLVDEYISKNKDFQPCMVRNGKCKICFKNNNEGE